MTIMTLKNCVMTLSNGIYHLYAILKQTFFSQNFKLKERNLAIISEKMLCSLLEVNQKYLRKSLLHE